jgi:hypothetical protein
MAKKSKVAVVVEEEEEEVRMDLADDDSFQDELIAPASPLDDLVSGVLSSSRTVRDGIFRSMPVRLYTNLFEMAVLLSERSAISRNQMMNKITAVGIDAALAAMPSKVAAELRAECDRRLQVFFNSRGDEK